MPFEKLSPAPETFLQTLQEAAAPLFYLSETDMPVRVHRLTGSDGLVRFSTADLLQRFFPSERKLKVEWAGMERTDSKGFNQFFRTYTDRIIQNTPDSFTVRYPEELDQLEKWRTLRNIWMDHCVRQRWFKVHLSDGAKKAVFAVGQLLTVEFDADTNELRTQPGEWFVLETGTIET